MKTVKCICDKCQKEFLKNQNEYNRSKLLGRKYYCSRICSATGNALHFGKKVNRIPPKKGPANPFLYYIRNCKRRGQHDFDLTIEYLKELWDNQGGKCAYSRLDLKLNNHSKRDADIRYTASVDRIDSGKGYIKGNIQFISTAINYMKHTMSHEHTVEFLNQLSHLTFIKDRTISSSTLL